VLYQGGYVLHQTISNEIKRLPAKHQLVLSLCYMDQLSLYEISRVLEKTPVQIYRLYLEAIEEICKNI